MSGVLAFLGTVVVGWILFNLVGALIVGLVARAMFAGRVQVGWFKTLVIGFLGGILGKLVFWVLRWPTGFPMDFVASVLGAFALFFAYVVRRGARGATAK